MGIRLKYRVKYRVGMMLLAAWFILSLLPVYVMAKDASYSLSVSNSTSIKGNQVVVTVTGSDLTDVYGFEINLKYDTNLLLYKKVKACCQGSPSRLLLQMVLSCSLIRRLARSPVYREKPSSQPLRLKSLERIRRSRQ